MSVTVWVDAWQQQCCGAPFAVGDEVRWRLSDVVDRTWLEPRLGPDVAGDVRYAEDHHDEDGPRLPRRAARVLSVARVDTRYVVDPGDGRTMRPVPGSGVTRPLREVTGQEDELPGEHLDGYLVALALDGAGGTG